MPIFYNLSNLHPAPIFPLLDQLWTEKPNKMKKTNTTKFIVYKNAFSFFVALSQAFPRLKNGKQFIEKPSKKCTKNG